MIAFWHHPWRLILSNMFHFEERIDLVGLGASCILAQLVQWADIFDQAMAEEHVDSLLLAVVEGYRNRGEIICTVKDLHLSFSLIILYRALYTLETNDCLVDCLLICTEISVC